MSQQEDSKCHNFELCQNDKVTGIGSDFCMTCGSWFKVCGFGWDKLIFIDSTDECVVCMNLCDRKLMFPTNCGHSFCVECSKNILFWDETRYHLSPVPSLPKWLRKSRKGETMLLRRVRFFRG